MNGLVSLICREEGDVLLTRRYTWEAQAKLALGVRPGEAKLGSLENRGEIQGGWCHDDRLWGIYALRTQPFLDTVLCLCILVQVVQS